MRPMRTLFLAIALAAPLCAAQQPAQPPAGSNWQHVQALPIGTSIQVSIQAKASTRPHGLHSHRRRRRLAGL
jgi:hypothetical protein